MMVRPETPNDFSAVYALNSEAFGAPGEADLVEALRRQARPVVSLVAENDGHIVGHIMFSPVTLPGSPTLKVMGLAPMAVLPAHQNQGIGSALVRAGLDACRELGYGAVVVLGHVEYYPRFGFVPASRFGIACEYEVPDEAFMALELVRGCLAGHTGTIKYHPAFAAL